MINYKQKYYKYKIKYLNAKKLIGGSKSSECQEVSEILKDLERDLDRIVSNDDEETLEIIIRTDEESIIINVNPNDNIYKTIRKNIHPYGKKTIKKISFGGEDVQESSTFEDIEVQNNAIIDVPEFYEYEFNSKEALERAIKLYFSERREEAIELCGPIKYWNTYNITDMSNLFFNNQNLFYEDLNEWDVSNVTNMQGMFAGALYFNPNISNWDVSNVINMQIMFAGTKEFNIDISGWNVGKVTNMMAMFAKAESFNIDISNWDVNNVTSYKLIFSKAESFTKEYNPFLKEK